ncbi:MAG: hypothetical protein GY801_12930 [bacterium]|nr:hypothetical protein [bacterium]
MKTRILSIIFIRFIGHAKSIPFFIDFKSYHGNNFGALNKSYGIDVLKERRDEILYAIPTPNEEGAGAFEQFEMHMRAYMESIIDEERKKLLPELQDDHDHYTRMVEELKKLESTISNGNRPWESQYSKDSEWGGADVIVTSDPERSGYEGDIVVLLDDPAPVVWIMETLRELCAEYIDYMNKYAFYVFPAM